MDNSLRGVLARIPGLAGYLGAQQNDQQQQLGQLHQIGGLQAILARQQAGQREQQFRGALSQLGPNATSEQLAQVAAQFAPAGEVLRSQTASADRRATMEARAADAAALREQRLAELTQRGEQEITRIREQETQRRISKEEADARERTTREYMARLAASLRPAPAPEPLQAVLGDDGKPVLVPRSQAVNRQPAPTGGQADKPMTEFQGKALLYGTRTAQSDKVLRALEDKIFTAGLAAGQATGVVGNAFLSSEQRRVDQAQRDFVNAVLRQESGAVISDAEFANAKKQYFPQPGDDQKTIDQKRANRQLAIQGFVRMSGPGRADIEAILKDPLLPGVPATARTPQQASGRLGYVETRRTADGRTLGKKADGTIEEIK